MARVRCYLQLPLGVMNRTIQVRDISARHKIIAGSAKYFVLDSTLHDVISNQWVLGSAHWWCSLDVAKRHLRQLDISAWASWIVYLATGNLDKRRAATEKDPAAVR